MSTRTRFDKMVSAAIKLIDYGALVSSGPSAQGKAVKRHWKDTMTDDPAEVRKMLSGGAVNALIIPTGRLVIADDDKPGAHEWLVEHGLPESLEVTTPSKRVDADGEPYDSHHHYLLAPEGFDVTTLPNGFWGGELRRSLSGEQNMVLGPWAMRPDGLYAVTKSLAPAEMPASLIDALMGGTGTRRDSRNGHGPSITVTGPWQWGDKERGSRHDHLKSLMRTLRGDGVNDPKVQLGMLWKHIEDHAIPLTREGNDPDIDEAELLGIIAWVNEHIDDDEPGGEFATRVVRPTEPLLASNSEALPFPMDPGDTAFDGPIGELVASTAGLTSASRTGMLASALAILGALAPSSCEYHGLQHSNVFVGLVGATGSGKGTATEYMDAAITSCAGPWYDQRLASLGSGEFLPHRMAELQKTHTFVRLVAIEEEYKRLLMAGRREGSTVGQMVRMAFDGRTISTGTVRGGNIVVNPGYWLSLIAHVSPTELRDGLLGSTDVAGGSVNRVLWLPVRHEQGVTASGLLPHLTQHIGVGSVIKDAIDKLSVAPAQLALTDVARKALDNYREFVPTQGGDPDLTTRLHIHALRIAMVHAAVEGSSEVTLDHVRRGFALTVYAQDSLTWVLGHGLSMAAQVMLAALDEAGGRLTGRQQKEALRDPERRLKATDELIAKGLAEAVTESSGPRGGPPVRALVRRL